MADLDPVRVARQVRKLYRLSVPVDPERLARNLGILVLSAEFSEQLSGVLVPETYGNETRYLILVNSRHRRTRRRFSIAHELGHFFLHRGLQPAFTHLGKSQGRLEREADLFAAELLMPEGDVRLAAQLTNFSGLVRAFEVSAAAMRRRLTELGITPKGEIA